MRDQRIKEFEKLKHYVSNMPNAINKAQCLTITDYTTDNNKVPTPSVVFYNEQVIKTIIRYDNPLTLVFGSAKNPGGGVLRGSTAQEEDISLSSTWYFHVKDNDEFYNINHTDLTYSDKMLYVNEAYMIKDDFGHYITPRKVSFIGGAAPNLNGMKSKGALLNENNVYEILRTRIKGLLSFAELHNHKTFIVGAWGCGVFGLDNKKVALIFKECIQDKIYSGLLVFAILDKEQYTVFQNTIAFVK
jgi:uncharacterized protein (TIGR02452 family)